jgi:hypothetical protein
MTDNVVYLSPQKPTLPSKAKMTETDRARISLYVSDFFTLPPKEMRKLANPYGVAWRATCGEPEDVKALASMDWLPKSMKADVALKAVWWAFYPQTAADRSFCRTIACVIRLALRYGIEPADFVKHAARNLVEAAKEGHP